MLKGNTRLSIVSILNLRGCALGSEGIVKLSEGLKGNQTLLDLNIASNLFGKICMKALMKSLPTSLTHLNISDN